MDYQEALQDSLNQVNQRQNQVTEANLENLEEIQDLRDKNQQMEKSLSQKENDIKSFFAQIKELCDKREFEVLEQIQSLRLKQSDYVSEKDNFLIDKEEKLKALGNLIDNSKKVPEFLMTKGLNFLT